MIDSPHAKQLADGFRWLRFDASLAGADVCALQHREKLADVPRPPVRLEEPHGER